jgi:SAM-dependent methyltransferase
VKARQSHREGPVKENKSDRGLVLNKKEASVEKALTKVNTIRLQNLSYAHKQSGTFRAAIELELFTAISRGASGIADIQNELGLTALNTERLVVACSGLELLEKEGEVYRNAPDVERFLVKGKPTYIGPWLLFNGFDFERWKDLAALLKSQAPPKVLGMNESLSDDEVRRYHEATYSVGLGAGMLFARDVDLSRRSLLLDLGGGSGAYCIAAVQRYPHLKAVVLDFMPVCRIAREFIAQWKMEDKISTHAADFTNDPFPPGADCMVMASNLPQYNEILLTKIIQKAYQSLEPGGEFHLVGETLSDDKMGPLGPSLWGIHEVLFGSQGRSHSEQEVKAYLSAAGFIEVMVHPFIPGSLTRISARKP